MKLLLFYAPEFWFRTHSKSIAEAPDDFREGRVEKCIVVFVHAEPKDAEDRTGVLTKTIKNVKWLAGKFDSRAVVLHFFSHLGSETASPEFAQALVAEARARLESVGFAVETTPFGHFCEFRLAVAGESLAKVFKEF